VRGAEGKGHVEGARGEDRELPESVESRWEEVGVRRRQRPGRHDGAAQGRGTQGRARDREEAIGATQAGLPAVSLATAAYPSDGSRLCVALRMSTSITNPTGSPNSTRSTTGPETQSQAH